MLTTEAIVKSPATYIDVLNMSSNLSTPAIIAIASRGIPTDEKTIVIITNATDGTPAAPILPIVAVRQIIKYSWIEKLIPKI